METQNALFKSAIFLVKAFWIAKMYYLSFTCMYILLYRTLSIKPFHTKRPCHSICTAFFKACQHTVGSPRNTPNNIKCSSYSMYTTSSQRPYSIHTTFSQRLYSAHGASTARTQLLQRVHGAHSVLMTIIAFKCFYLFIIWASLFSKHSDLFLLFEAIRHRI